MPAIATPTAKDATFRLDFAAYDNNKRRLIKTIYTNDLSMIVEAEEFTPEESRGIVLAAEVLLDKYIALRYKDCDYIQTPQRPRAYLRLLCVTSLTIVVKFCADLYFLTADDIAQYTNQNIRDLLELERNVLKVLDYNIWPYMPVRDVKEILAGSPVVKPYEHTIPKHLLPVSLDEPKPLVAVPPKTSTSASTKAIVPTLDHDINDPWSCLCEVCEKLILSNPNRHKYLVAYPRLSMNTFMQAYGKIYEENRSILANEPGYGLKTRSRLLAVTRSHMYRLLISNWSLYLACVDQIELDRTRCNFAYALSKMHGTDLNKIIIELLYTTYKYFPRELEEEDYVDIDIDIYEEDYRM